MSNTVEKEQENINTSGTLEGKTNFSQEDVNRIVSERLSQEKQKLEREMSKKEAELKEKEFQMKAEQFLSVKGYPETLLKAFNCSDMDSLSSAVGILEEHFTLKPLLKDYRPGNPAALPFCDEQKTEIRSAMGLN